MYSNEILRSKLGCNDSIEYHVNWPEVAAKYSGIEIAPECNPMAYLRPMNWASPIGTTTGCIWDRNAILNFTILSL